MLAKGRGREERRGALAENHGFFLFFLLLPKVLLLPSVTLAKNCEQESKCETCMVSDVSSVGAHPLSEGSRASRHSRTAE